MVTICWWAHRNANAGPSTPLKYASLKMTTWRRNEKPTENAPSRRLQLQQDRRPARLQVHRRCPSVMVAHDGGAQAQTQPCCFPVACAGTNGSKARSGCRNPGPECAMRICTMFASAVASSRMVLVSSRFSPGDWLSTASMGKLQNSATRPGAVAAHGTEPWAGWDRC